ncbi:hypothetical protein [Sulfobacillus thermosulfidooxidans]|uniref:hypothetical protein n=1 Tax=Sulfobacillus thermosulfidooxidans TaxID=28034 RepID=UPI0006B436EA|nr:hypothetical protein [Sulfobacillus thermosulfidooxidans]
MMSERDEASNPFDFWQDAKEAPIKAFLDGRALHPGAHVLLHPKKHQDIFDAVLAGKLATVESIQEDWEGRIYVVVTVDEDPGRDLGQEQLVGHRFFFDLDEVSWP